MRGVTYKAAVDLHEELNDSSYVLLRANNIQDGELRFDDVQYVDRTKVKQKQLLRRGDILFCASSGSRGLVGKAALVRENMPVTFGAFAAYCAQKKTRLNTSLITFKVSNTAEQSRKCALAQT